MANELNEYENLDILPKNSDEKIAPKEENLSLKFLGKTYLAILIGLILLLPAIYIKNQIYYKSRDISVLWDEYSILLEENRDLRQNMETIRFKRQVLDPLEMSNEP